MEPTIGGDPAIEEEPMPQHFLRGMATLNFWADDVSAARDWYTKLCGTEADFQQPDAAHPAYVEFRIGDYQPEFGIIHRRYAPRAIKPCPGGAVPLRHVDDVQTTHKNLLSMGATEYETST